MRRLPVWCQSPTQLFLVLSEQQDVRQPGENIKCNITWCWISNSRQKYILCCFSGINRTRVSWMKLHKLRPQHFGQCSGGGVIIYSLFRVLLGILPSRLSQIISLANPPICLSNRLFLARPLSHIWTLCTSSLSRFSLYTKHTYGKGRGDVFVGSEGGLRNQGNC